jgi:WD40 repeat protein
VTEAGEGPALTGPGDRATTDCPFAGFDFYTEDDAIWFFGRERERQIISANLRAGRLTVLYAESAVGKSSLLRAGVAAKLREVARKRVASGRDPQYLPVVFSEWNAAEPTDALTAAIRRAVGEFCQLDTLPRTDLAETIDAASAQSGATILVVLDQFEEYFVYRAGEQQPGRFAQELANCVNRPDARANFLIAIREDAYAGLGDLFAGKIANVYGNHLHLDPLVEADACNAIVGPISAYNRLNPERPVELEDGLVDSVLDRIRSVSVDGASPTSGSTDVSPLLLQLVMRAIWESEARQRSRVLRLDTLSRLPVSTIVDAKLAGALHGLKRRERDVATDLFDHLVTASGGKVAEPVADLAARTGHSESEVGTVLGKLADARIVRAVAARSDRDQQRYRRYEIFHDMLTPAINRVIAAQATEKRLRRARRIGVVVGALLLVAAGVAAALVVLWQSTAHERDVAQSERLTAESERFAAAAQRYVAVDPELATLLALKAERASPTSDAIDAVAAAYPAIQELWTRGTSDDAGAESVSFSPDGRRVLVGTDGGTIEQLGVRNGSGNRSWPSILVAGPASANTTGVNSAVYNKDATIIVAATSRGRVRLFDAANGKALPDPQEPRGGWGAYATAVAYNSHFTEFAAADNRSANNGPGVVDIWTSSGRFEQQIVVSPTAMVDSVAFSPSEETEGSEMIAAGTEDGGVALFDDATGSPVETLAVPGGVSVTSVQFSPDGRSVLAAYDNDKVIVWDVASGRSERVFNITGGADNAVFSPDGSDIVATSDLGTAVVWNLTTGAQVTVLRSNLGPVVASAFDPTKDEIATASDQGYVSVWQARPAFARRTVTLSAAYGPILEDVLDPTTGDVYAVTTSGALVQWNPKQPANTSVRVVTTHEDGSLYFALALIPGRELLSIARGGSLLAWDLKTLAPVPLAGAPTNVDGLAYLPAKHLFFISTNSHGVEQGHVGSTLDISRDYTFSTTANWSSVSFNSSGSRLVIGDSYGNLYTYDLSRNKPLRGPHVPRNLYEFSDIDDAEYSSDGSRLVVADNDGSVYVLDTQTHKRIATLRADSAPVYTARFAPHRDDEVVTASEDGTARVWDVTTDTQQEVLPDPGPTTVDQADFTGNGKSVVTVSDGGTLAEWSVAPLGALVRDATWKIDHVATPWVRSALLQSH